MTNMIIDHYLVVFSITSPYIHILCIIFYLFMKHIVVCAIYNKNDIFIIWAFIIISHYPNCILY